MSPDKMMDQGPFEDATHPLYGDLYMLMRSQRTINPEQSPVSIKATSLATLLTEVISRANLCSAGRISESEAVEGLNEQEAFAVLAIVRHLRAVSQ